MKRSAAYRRIRLSEDVTLCLLSPINLDKSKAVTLDPTVRFEQNSLQVESVDLEKRVIYESCGVDMARGYPKSSQKFFGLLSLLCLPILLTWNGFGDFGVSPKLAYKFLRIQFVS